MSDARSYRDRTGHDADPGVTIQVGYAPSETRGRWEVLVEIGIMCNRGSFSSDAFVALTPAEARELANDLRDAADKAEARHG